MGNDYYKGVFAAYLGTGFMSHPIPEWQIDMIKEKKDQPMKLEFILFVVEILLESI